MKFPFKATLSLLLMIVLFFLPKKSEACKDCPFPMKIAENRWLMPNSYIIVSISEYEIFGRKYIKVDLIDSRTNELIASGKARHSKYQRSLTLTLHDGLKHKVNGMIRWVNPEEAIIQAKFECEEENQCSLNLR